MSDNLNVLDTPPSPPPPPPTPPPSPVSATGTSLWVWLALVLSGAGVAGGLGLAALLFLFALVIPGSDMSPLPGLTICGVSVFGLPLAWAALRQVRLQPAQLWQAPRWWMVAGLGSMVLALLVGEGALRLNIFPDFVIGLAQWVAVVGSAGVLVALTAGRWRGQTRLRANWHFVSGAWGAVGISLIVEVIVLIGLGILGVVVLVAVAPNELQDLERFFRTYSRTEDPQLLLQWVSRPWVLISIFGGVSVLLPLLEELIKPLGVILVLGQRPSPMAAFMGGVLGGVGFGVVESLFNLSTRQETWGLLIIARTGTLIMHALTTGLVGWGWGQLAATRRPWRLMLAYFAAVSIHGLWNAGAIGLALLGESVADVFTFSAETLAQTGGMLLSLFCLTSLGVLGLIMLAWLGHRLRRSEA